MTEDTNRHLRVITEWGARWQVEFAAEKTQAVLISRSRENARMLEGQIKFGVDTLAIQDSVNILRVEVDSRLCFDRHLESVARKASLKVTLLRRVRNLLDAVGLLKLYKAQVRPIMEYSPLTWMCSAQGHLSLLDKVQRRAERLISDNYDHQQRHHPGQQLRHRPHERRPQQQHRHPPEAHQNASSTPMLDSLEHRRRVGALTVLHKAQVQYTPHLAALRVPWRRCERTTRTVVSDLLLEIPMAHTTGKQRAFTCATSLLWNAFTAAVEVRHMSTQQVKVAAHTWLRSRPP